MEVQELVEKIRALRQARDELEVGLEATKAELDSTWLELCQAVGDYPSVDVVIDLEAGKELDEEIEEILDEFEEDQEQEHNIA